jgi:hypothetical protein
MYSESLTLPDWVSVFAPNASLVGNQIIGDGCRLAVSFLMATSGVCVSKTSGTISGLVQAALMQLTGAANGTVCTSGSLDCQIDTVVNAGTGYVFGGSSTASLNVIFNVILLTSISGGSAVNFSSSGKMSISGNTITDIGFSTGIITSSTSIVSAKMARIACATAVNVGVGSTLQLLIASLTGTETSAGTYKVTKAGVTAAHHTTHENGGSDQISVAGLSGLLATAQNPVAHATSHKSGGGDSIKLDELAAPTDITTLDASTSAHGLMKKYPGGTATFLRADGSFAATPPRKIIQTANVAVTLDTTTTSLTWADLLTINMTTQASILDVFFSVCCDYNPNSGKDDNIYFRITVDTVAKWGTGGHGTTGSPIAASIKWAGTVTAAAHAVVAQWKLNSKGTGSIKPVTVPDWQHAQMVVYEVEPAS